MSTEYWGYRMSWSDELEAGLPAPEQHEPPALRQDIVDELSDHLQCALNRELLNHPDQDGARSRVLTRFGPSPQKLARQLWLDAMKETLMSNRLTLTSVAVLVAVCLTLCGMMWTQSQQFRELAMQAQAETHALMQQRDEASQKLLDQNRELLDRLSELDQQPTRNPGWNPLKVRVVLDGEEQTPGTGFLIDVRGKALSESEEIGLHEQTGDDGLASFGVVRPGQYRISVTAPWGEESSHYTVVRPGTEPVIEVVAPREAPKPTDVRPAVDWPEVLQGLDVAVVCEAERSDETEVNDRHWRNRTDRYLLIRQDGTVAEYQFVAPDQNTAYPGGRPPNEASLTGQLEFHSDPILRTDGLPWHGTAAQITSLQLVKLAADDQLPAEGSSLPMLSPSPLFARYSAFRSGGLSQKRQDSLRLEFSIDNPGWTISIPEHNVRELVAAFAPEEFPELPETRVALGTMYFLQADTDRNGELSEPEAAISQRTTRIKFTEFPVTRPYFVKSYVESRSASATGRSARSESFPGQSSE